MASNSGDIQAAHTSLIKCRVKLVTDIAHDPHAMADYLFEIGVIAPSVKKEVCQIPEITDAKARRLVDALEDKVKSYPEYFHQFLAILQKKRVRRHYADLLQTLKAKYCELGGKEVITVTEGNSSDEEPTAVDEHELFPVSERKGFEFPEFEDLPTGDGSLMPDPLEYPPGKSQVGEDITANRGDLSYGDTIEGRLLKAFQTGDFREAATLLGHVDREKNPSLKSIADVDKKTLLHLASRGDWMRWLNVVKRLVEKYNCDVSALDQDDNTPLHVASNFANEGMVKYLLTCKSCKPNAFNDEGYTALHIAVQKGHKIIVRALLSSGVVDPTLPSKHGHTLSELVELWHHPKPYASEHQGSPIEMVDLFVKCIENNNYGQQPFTNYTYYCLLDILQNVFKNEDSITIREITDRIRHYALPLPEEAAEISSLLCGLQAQTRSHFSIHMMIPTSGCVEDTVISKKELFPADFVSEVCPDKPVKEDVQQGPSKHVSEDRNSEVLKPVIRKPQGPSRDNDGVSPKDRIQSAEQQSNELKKPPFPKACIILMALFVTAFCVYGVSLLFAVSFGPSTLSLDGTSFIQQIQEEAVTIIARINTAGLNSVTFIESFDTELIPIDFYAGNCEDEFINSENIHIISRSMLPSPGSSIDERYILNGSMLTILTNFQIRNISFQIDCFATLVVFDDVTQYLEFLDVGTWTQSYVDFCIRNNTSTHNFTVTESSFYYTGLSIPLPSTIVGSVENTIIGTVYEYSIARFMSGCSISASSSTSCSFQLSSLNLQGVSQLCVLGVVTPSLDAVVREAKINYSTEGSKALRNAGTLTPLIVIGLFFIVLTIIVLVCASRLYYVQHVRNKIHPGAIRHNKIHSGAN